MPLCYPQHRYHQNIFSIFFLYSQKWKDQKHFHYNFLNIVEFEFSFFFFFFLSKIEFNNKVCSKTRWHPISFAILPLILTRVFFPIACAYACANVINMY